MIAGGEVLVVKGALGAMGAGNTSVLMQLLIGMLDAALARQQDLVPAAERVAVALKVDEAPLVLNRGFAETLALKRSAGLETVACWQTDAQWTDREVRDQLDALFAHRVYFATASVARRARGRQADDGRVLRRRAPGDGDLSALGRPDARLHLPKPPRDRQLDHARGPPAAVRRRDDPAARGRERLALHAARQAERGGRYRTDLRQPHWERAREPASAPATDACERSLRMGRLRSPTPPRRFLLPLLLLQLLLLLLDGSWRPASDRPSRKSGIEVPLSVTTGRELQGARGPRRRPQRALGSGARPPRALTPDPLDLEILLLVAEMRHVLSSQIHRRFNPSARPRPRSGA